MRTGAVGAVQMVWVLLVAKGSYGTGMSTNVVVDTNSTTISGGSESADVHPHRHQKYIFVVSWFLQLPDSGDNSFSVTAAQTRSDYEYNSSG